MTAGPDVVAHADWSLRPAKRWLALVTRSGGRRELSAVEPVGSVAARVAALRGLGSSVLLGIDVTLGLPERYARAAGIADFAGWVRSAPLDDYARPAAHPSDVSLARPFYPARPGGASQADLVTALGAARFDDLRRHCERSPPMARAACPLFWTLGANQVGRASVTAWTELVQAHDVRLWPFDGALAELVDAGGVVVAETYPSACAGFLGVTLGPRESKRRQGDRAARAGALLAAAARLEVAVAPHVQQLIAAGFGPSAVGEDAYDAVVGVLGMVSVLVGDQPHDPPPEVAAATTVEGWVLGLG